MHIYAIDCIYNIFGPLVLSRMSTPPPLLVINSSLPLYVRNCYYTIMQRIWYRIYLCSSLYVLIYMGLSCDTERAHVYPAPSPIATKFNIVRYRTIFLQQYTNWMYDKLYIFRPRVAPRPSSSDSFTLYVGNNCYHTIIQRIRYRVYIYVYIYMYAVDWMY